MMSDLAEIYLRRVDNLQIKFIQCLRIFISEELIDCVLEEDSLTVMCLDNLSRCLSLSESRDGEVLTLLLECVINSLIEFSSLKFQSQLSFIVLVRDECCFHYIYPPKIECCPYGPAEGYRSSHLSL